MSFFTKTPKVQPAPAAPSQDIAPVTTPASSRLSRLATQGRASTFLGTLGQKALGAPGPTLTGLNS